ncbi:hypothetical protein FOA43_001273 [Brettanomyces nanus]|uniref:Uncharacterized protein n=1 Tax=Eeniella nana TaxID=13502 RepID=A0A875RZ11_EENNA|nr:uncharacterized protein FOA43_001273 [Brettanomyces nanus]QPG73958.1 hypothetical protein FOA43_001273 [Brettanomyces nanus]
MHLNLIFATLLIYGVASAVVLPPKTTAFEPFTTQVSKTTGSPLLDKRDPRRKVIVNKEWLKEESEKNVGTHKEEGPDPWLRTIYGSIAEVVTPTVIGGITFSTKPPETASGTEWWISIKNDGSPKTIKPKIKNGQVKNGLPDVKTYFQTATTIVHKQEDIQAHNLKKGDEVNEVIMIPEDDTYVKLSPLMRCTPDFYFHRGMANMDISEPFCRPKDNSKLRVGKTYFVTWFSRFYDDVKTVRFHYAYVKEKISEAGMKVKRDIRGPVKDVANDVAQLSEDAGSFKGEVPGAFFTSDWVLNAQGFFPVDVDKKWLKGSVYKKVLIAIQPDSVTDDEFRILDAPHLIVDFRLKEIVGKNTKQMRKEAVMPVTGDDIYYVIMGIPTLVVVALLLMYLFVQANRKQRDLSGIRKPRRSRFGNAGRYEVPYGETDIHRPGTLKQS